MQKGSVCLDLRKWEYILVNQCLSKQGRGVVMKEIFYTTENYLSWQRRD